MTISATVIAHSRVHGSPDLISLQLRYPRMIHSEFMTHRVFSRNASSSRAVPIERMIRDVIDDPAMPAEWGTRKPGMQAGPQLDADDIEAAKREWLLARDHAVWHATALNDMHVHKQVVNRLLEPFGHITVICTATDWQNFFDLRCHPDADPTMRNLAEAMQDAIESSDGYLVNWPDPDHYWHLPYVDESDHESVRESVIRPQHGGLAPFGLCMEKLALISAARCARVSYLNHDGSNPNIEKDLLLASKLLESRHMSPFEHQARSARGVRSANFSGWHQYRRMLEQLMA